MKILLALIFLASAALLLSKKLTTRYLNWWLNLDNKTLSFLGLSFIPISISFILWASNVPAWNEFLWRILLFIIGITSLIEALTFLFFPSAIKQLIRSFISLGFYLWAIPSVIVCLVLSLLLLIGS